MKIRGVGFDLGETLVFYRGIPLNWSALYPKALLEVANVCKLNPTPAQFAAAEEILMRNNTRIFPRSHEVSAQEILSAILAAWGHADTAFVPAAIETFFTFFQQRMEVYSDTIPTLTLLRERNLSIGILTDVPYGMPGKLVQRDLEAAGISGLVDTLLTSVEVGVRKPEPAGYLALAGRLQIAPEEMLYVGNEPKDVLGACRAGVVAVFLDRLGSGGSHGQQFTISTLASLSEIIACLPGL